MTIDYIEIQNGGMYFVLQCRLFFGRVKDLNVTTKTI